MAASAFMSLALLAGGRAAGAGAPRADPGAHRNATGSIELFGRPLRERLPIAVSGAARHKLRRLRGPHSGHIGDYVARWTAGAGALGTVRLLALS